MKNNLFFILLFISISSYTTIKNVKTENNFEFIFGHCFEKDTISVAINNISVIQNLTLTTDIQQGLTPYKLIYRDKSIYLNDEKILNDAFFSKDVTFSITRNNKERFLISKDLRNGKYFVMNGCTIKENDLRIVQYKKAPIFD